MMMMIFQYTFPSCILLTKGSRSDDSEMPQRLKSCPSTPLLALWTWLSICRCHAGDELWPAGGFNPTNRCQ